MAEQAEDIIRIRLDIGRAVEARPDLLAESGENGAATAVWQQLAPFRLVEYAYVDPGVGPLMSGAYLGFPDGSLYDVGADIPDQAVADLVALAPLPPLYLYLPLAEPVSLARVAGFVEALSAHLDLPLLAVLGGDVRLFDAAACRAARVEGERQFGREVLFARIRAQTCRADGRAYATLTQAFTRHLLEFASVAERDAFIAWTRAVCDRLFAEGAEVEAFRPAEIARIPVSGAAVVRAVPPAPETLESVAAMRAAWSAILAGSRPHPAGAKPRTPFIFEK